MCGRYALYGPSSRLRERFDADIDGLDFRARYNAAPAQWLPVVRHARWANGSRAAHPVSKAVGKVRNDEPDLIAAV